MTIPTDAKPKPLDLPNYNVQAVDPRTGLFTSEELQRQQKLANYINGGGRIIPCSASGTNLITLTPNDASPLLAGYSFGDAFAFYAAESSTGSVTMTVVPRTGVLATLKAYKTNGAAQAGSGDVVQNSVYIAYYAPHLDASAGGFVLK